MSKAKNKLSAGPGNLPPIFLRNTSSTLSFPLAILFRSFFDLKNLPSEWKHSIITLKFKKGDPSAVSNYHPIALTCVCSKIFESILSNELLFYLTKHDLITKHQHAFLKKHSTITQGRLSPLGHGGTPPLIHRNIPPSEVFSQTPRLGSLGSIVSSSAGSGAEPQRPTHLEHLASGADPGIYFGGPNQGPNRKLRGEARIEGAKRPSIEGVKPESRALRAEELMAKPKPRAKPEKKAGEGSGEGAR